MSNNIEGKVIVITGASSGLGEAAARLLSAEGAAVVLGARGASIAFSRWQTSSPVRAARPSQYGLTSRALTR